MPVTDSTSLVALLWIALAAGVGHTLAGPDHYVPLIAVGRARDWSARRGALVAAGLGLGHCLVSVAIALGLLATADSGNVPWLDGLAGCAAWTLIAAGLALAVCGWRRRRGATVASGAAAGRRALGLLGLAFLLGPCEWLIPVAVAAGTSHGPWGAAGVAAVYTLGTVAIMVAATCVGLAGARRAVPARHADWLAAGTTVACGLLLLAGC